MTVTVGQLAHFVVSCFLNSRSGFLYTFCVYSPCSVNGNDCARRLDGRVTIMWLARQLICSDKKVQQGWQTSALAMHLHPARLISMPVIFCLLSSSSIVIFVFYLFSTGISEQHAWKLWVWIQSESTGLTLPLRVTPMNNPITLISPVQSLGYIFVALTVICVALQISE